VLIRSGNLDEAPAGPPPPPPPDWPDQDETGFGRDSLNPDGYEQVCRWFTS